MMNKIKLTLIVIGIVAFGAVSYLVLNSFNRYMDLQAIHDCASDYRQQIVKSETVTVIRPLEQQAHDCAFQKGVRNWNGIWTDLDTSK